MSTNLEIERKFVVNSTHPEWICIRDSQKGKRLTQATIHKDKGYKLRIRMIEDLDTGERSSFFCFKVSQKGEIHDPQIRDEYEWPVPDRTALYMMIGHGEVSKVRRTWESPTGEKYEIDEYEGDNTGVITADIELRDTLHAFVKPVFTGWEVTFDARLSNSNLQNTDMSFAHWTTDMRDWYHTLETGDGTSMFPIHEPHVHHHKNSKWHKRLKRAWRILVGKEV